MSLSIGIVGLPNVGKSTLFNALLRQQAALAANYPFATIEPNTGVVPVPDERLEKLAQIVGTQVIKPATVTFVDIAGLVAGAHEGEGLGNKFLGHIREVDLVCHVVRAFSDEQVIREGSVDPKADLEIIETELLMADLETLEKQKAPKGSIDSSEKVRWSLIERWTEAARKGKLVNTQLESDEARALAKELSLLTAKQALYVVNVDENEIADSDNLREKFAQQLGKPQTELVIVSAKVESELAGLEDDEQQLFLEELGVKMSGLERLIERAYGALSLQSFLTAGEKEVRAWTVPIGATAPEAAGVIHTDFEKKFIKAKVASVEDFLACGGWKGLREVGKVRLEGRDYVMRPDDVVEFMVGA